MTWEAMVNCGDSLSVGTQGGMQIALGFDDIPVVNLGRSTESLHTFLVGLTGASAPFSAARRGAMSRPLGSCASVQALTNDANLNAPTQTLTGTGLGSWQEKQRWMVRWLRYRGIDKVAWATIPPNTLSTDGWASPGGQYLDMAGRGPRQQLMQDWNLYLTGNSAIGLYDSPRLLYKHPTEGWAIYSPPAGQGFGPGSIIYDPWAPVTTFSVVNTATVLASVSSPPAGYDFGGQKILKWLPFISNDGLHDHADGTVRALGCRGMISYMKGELL